MGTWEHRAILEGNKGTRTPPWETLSTGISRHEYWTAVREDKDIEWRCPLCPLLESTRLEEEVLGESCLSCLLNQWTQALWRKVQELGLEPPYRTDSRTYKYIRKLMALPFLPAARILPESQRLKDGARTASLEALVQYVENNWISSTVWPPAAWSVYMLPIRINNDVEGWHNSLNRRANNRVHLPFYLFVELLHQEVRLVSIKIKLVSDGKLSCSPRYSNTGRTSTTTRSQPAASSSSAATITALHPEAESPERYALKNTNGSFTKSAKVIINVCLLCDCFVLCF